MKNIEKQLKQVLRENFEEKYHYHPIGHHHLGRHYVFSLKDDKDTEYILKIYGKKNRWYKEVTALNLLRNDIPCPKIIKKGKSENGFEWIVMSRLPGTILEKVWHEIPSNNKKVILKEMGEILSIIHNHACYNYFGPWKSICNTLSSHTNFLEYRKEKDLKIINDIKNHNLPEKEFLIKAFNEMKGLYNNLRSDNDTCICHHDFSPRNTLVVKDNDSWKISGIIDFEHCYPNDPYIDFTDLYQTIFISKPEYEQFFLSGYTKRRNLEKDFHKKIRYYLFNKGLFICSWAYTNANDYYNEGIKLLKWLMKK